MRDGAQHFHGLVTIKRSHLDGDDRLNLNEALPEFGVERASTHGGLQIKADQGNGLAYGAAVRNEFSVGGVIQCGKAQQTGIVSQPAQCFLLRVRPE